MNKLVQALAFASFSLTVTAFAASPAKEAAGPKVDCKNAMSTYDMNICAGLELKKADDELNVTYKQIMASLNKDAQSKDETVREQALEIRKRLLLSERAWVVFKLSDSNLQGIENLGGTAETLSYLGAEIEFTKARTKELKNLLRN